jgi:hypothetical protein
MPKVWKGFDGDAMTRVEKKGHENHKNLDGSWGTNNSRRRCAAPKF